ncbi:MAG: SLC13 family permease [Roseinatronobacter sp.]
MDLTPIAAQIGLSVDQLLVLLVLMGTIAAFLWNRLRHDLVAFGALLACVLAGLTPPETAFKGFGNHAVILVAFVLILSHGFQRSGAVDAISHWLVSDGARPWGRVLGLMGLGAVMSALLTNVGALAVLMPLGLQMASRNGIAPAQVLVPLSFGTIFGGMVTLIGSPANLLVSAFREDEFGAGFGMFDFAPVALPVALAGLGAVALLWRVLVPARARSRVEGFATPAYHTEARVAQGSRAVGLPLSQVEAVLRACGARMVSLLRAGQPPDAPRLPAGDAALQAGDVLGFEVAPAELPKALARLGLSLEEDMPLAPVVPGSSVGDRAVLGAGPGAGAPDAAELPGPRPGDEVDLMELVVLPGARLAGCSPRALRLRRRFGINLLAISRAGNGVPDAVGSAEAPGRRLRDTALVEGDVLLMQGRAEDIVDFASDHGCAPLGDRPLRVPSLRRMLLSVAILLGAALVAALGIVPAAVAYGVAAYLAIVTSVTPASAVLRSVDWSVVILLGALIPVAKAVEQTGLAARAAEAALALAGPEPGAVLVVGLLLGASMVLTNVLNNAAAVAMMAPVAYSLARGLDLPADPLLIAVAIGAQAGFLTPIGHQSNTLILSPSGLRFWDFWRLGLPLQLVVAAVALPMIALALGLGPDLGVGL